MKGLRHYQNSPCEPEVIEMLQHSNWIERETGQEAMTDAIEAWKWAIRNAKNKDMTLGWVLKIHRLMQRNLRPDIAGKWRDCDVWVGPHYRPYISEALIRSEVAQVLRVMCESATRKLPKSMREQLAKETHVRFEHCHPFEDGNGRVGRILYNIHRLKLGLPIHIIHEGDEQMEYYNWFRE